MKIFILIVVTSGHTPHPDEVRFQEFFDPSACERARVELRELGVTGTVCTPKRLVKVYG